MTEPAAEHMMRSALEVTGDVDLAHLRIDKNNTTGQRTESGGKNNTPMLPDPPRFG